MTPLTKELNVIYIATFEFEKTVHVEYKIIQGNRQKYIQDQLLKKLMQN